MIERANTEDAPELFKLHSESVRNICSNAYPEEIIESWNKGRMPEGLRPAILNDEFYIARDSGVIEGFVHFNSNEIIGLFIKYDCTGKGLGRALFEFALNKISERPVKIKSTLNAIGFYRHMGCASIGNSVVRRNDSDIYVHDMEFI